MVEVTLRLVETRHGWSSVYPDRVPQGEFYAALGLPEGCRRNLRRVVQEVGGDYRYLTGSRVAVQVAPGVWEVYEVVIDLPAVDWRPGEAMPEDYYAM